LQDKFIDDFDLCDVTQNESYGFFGEKAHDHMMGCSDQQKFCFVRLYADVSWQCFYIAILQALREKLDVTLEKVRIFKQECYRKICRSTTE
jgi:hypothetical protein